MTKSEKKDALNLEFDKLKLPVKWGLEDLVNRIDEFKSIFNDDNAFKEVKKNLKKMLNDISKT